MIDISNRVLDGLALYLMTTGKEVVISTDERGETTLKSGRMKVTGRGVTACLARFITPSVLEKIPKTIPVGQGRGARSIGGILRNGKKIKSQKLKVKK